MAEWFEAMPLIQQVFAIVGIAATVLLVIQVILMAVGLGHGADAGGALDMPDDVSGMPADMPADGGIYTSDTPVSPDTPDGGVRLLTMQGLVAFFAVFGWSGLVMLKSGLDVALSVTLAAVFGVVAMVLMALAIRSMLRLQQDGTLDIRNAVGCIGEVYLTVKANRSARGKVMVLVQGKLTELDAVTDDKKSIETGREVKIVGTLGQSALIVSALRKE